MSVFQATSDLLQQLQMHPEVASQMLAYLFFFSGTLLLNQVLDKGEWCLGLEPGSSRGHCCGWMQSCACGRMAQDPGQTKA